MKTLLLVRHAKSSWDDPALGDRARPLNDRGRRDAPKMGTRLARRGVRPDLILSSPATRALATAEAIAGELGYERGRIVTDERLYAAEPDRLLAVIRRLDDDARCVLLVGHNPELTALAHRFADTITHMPTCAVAEFTFDATAWTDVGRSQPHGVTFERPKDP